MGRKKKLPKNAVSDEEAWKVALENEGLVTNIIWKQFRWLLDLNTILDFDDLKQVGMMGLHHAVKLYNPALGYALSTYAYIWIKQYIGRAWMFQGFRCVRFPVHVQDQFSALRKKYGEKLDLRSLFDKGEITQEMLDVFSRMIHFHNVVELDKPVEKHDSSSEGGDMSFLDFILCEESESMYQALDHIDQKALVVLALNRLDSRQKEVIERRYGLSGKTHCTLRETGKYIGVTTERARQIEQKAFESLRKVLTENLVLLKHASECLD